MIVAIDGPSGAGKSTLAQRAAAALGWVYIDTGALYRAIGLGCLRAEQASPKQNIKNILQKIAIKVEYIAGQQHTFLGDEDVSEAIRTPEVAAAASHCAKQAEVRAFLLEQQRSLARAQSSILDGRDIGTVVLPEAEAKIFLVAEPEVRAQRRYQELAAKGVATTFAQVLQKMQARDAQDSNRALAPLRPAHDAFILDVSCLSIDEAVAEVLRIIALKKEA